jgi:hypothetical protein
MALLADTSKFTSGLNDANRQTKTFSQRLDGYAKSISRGMDVAAIAVVGFATKLAVDGVKAASDFEETLSKTRVVFGESSREIEKWASTAADKLGQTSTTALDAASNFASFGKAGGLSGKELVKFSKKLSILASDLASFENTSPADAIQALGAGLRGESEPMRRYKVFLNDAVLKQEAMKMGLYSGKGALDMSAKVMASYQTILKQTTVQQGDFGRTADGLANGQRRLTATLDEAKVTIGMALLPVIKDLVKYLNSPEGKKIVTEFAEGFASAMASLAESLPGILSKLQRLGNMAGKLGINWDSFADPKMVAAAAAFRMAPGGMKGKVIAGLIAYGATAAAEPLLNVDTSNAKSVVGTGLKAVGETGIFGEVGKQFGNLGNVLQIVGNAEGRINRQNQRRIQNNIVINIQNASDAISSARAIKRTLEKLELNGGSGAGVLGFN